MIRESLYPNTWLNPSTRPKTSHGVSNKIISKKVLQNVQAYCAQNLKTQKPSLLWIDHLFVDRTVHFRDKHRQTNGECRHKTTKPWIFDNLSTKLIKALANCFGSSELCYRTTIGRWDWRGYSSVLVWSHVKSCPHRSLDRHTKITIDFSVYFLRTRRDFCRDIRLCANPRSEHKPDGSVENDPSSPIAASLRCGAERAGNPDLQPSRKTRS